MVEPLEETIDLLTKKSKSNHIQRVQEGYCTLELGFIFNDCLHNLERVADHCSNIAVAVLESTKSSVHAHGYLRSIKESGDNQYQILLAGYTSKYNID
jgi:phosphate:Na+ symporter